MPLTDDEAVSSKTFGLGLCTSGKFKYDTRHAADRSHRHLSKVTKGRRLTMNVYRCETCHGWHLGTPAGAKR